MRRKFLSIIFVYLLIANFGYGQKKKATNTTQYPESWYDAMQWRSIGPFRGGRSAAVTGVKGNEKLFYMGTTGGGVWKTEDGGDSWQNISDGFFGGSIGSVTVSQFDPNVIYVGGGEVTVRGNVSYGYGVWKSEDAGKTWTSKGLKSSMHIPRMVVHPHNPEIVYAAALGDLYKSSEDRGIYKSVNGGDTWKKVLYANADAGAVDLVMDPLNPRVLYASTWRVRRTPYSLSSGGEGSDLWKSVDGGETWNKISGNEGLPKETLGIIGVTASPVKRDRIFAIIEAKSGGVFRSDDGGKTWTKTNEDRALRQRAWYYSRIYADTQDEDIVYVMNVSYHKSTDGGKTFKGSNAPHGDHHDLWIDPENNQKMIIADDGGGQISNDGGKSWSTYRNQPTAQFYRVTTDNSFPYRIYGAQQDNSTVRIVHRSFGQTIANSDWEPTAGGESAHLAIKPDDNDIVYGGSFDGYLSRYDHKTKLSRNIQVWPDNPMGHGAKDWKYRFQWNFPVFSSFHSDKKIYAASNHLHVSEDEGQTWKTISPDLTRNDTTKLGSSGGPITQDNTSVEYYCTIFAAAESPHEDNVIWTGSDDGLIHLTEDGGASWTNVTPSIFPEWIMINSIEVDPFTPGGLYVAATMYKWGDYQPYLYKTKDYGKTWVKIVNGIDGAHFTRVVRADPAKKGILYAGTESGMYISFDDGTSWKPFQLNLPIVPITDLAIKENNLIAATQGRSFWIIDDLTPLHQLSNSVKDDEITVFKPKGSYRMNGRQNKKNTTAGLNHPEGVMVYFYVKSEPDTTKTATIKFLDSKGKKIYAITSKDEKNPLKLKKGSNMFVWDMRYPEAEKFDGMIMWFATTKGPKAVPGNYKVRLVVGADSVEQEFEILKDPRYSTTDEEFASKFEFLTEINDLVTETHEAIISIRKTKKDLAAIKDKIDAESMHQKSIKKLESKLTKIEEALYQTKNQSNQDPLNFPIRLNNKLAHLSALHYNHDYPPTNAELEVKAMIEKEIKAQLSMFYAIRDQEIKQLNEALIKAEINFINAK